MGIIDANILKSIWRTQNSKQRHCSMKWVKIFGSEARALIKGTAYRPQSALASGWEGNGPKRPS
jgi:hypothetical protein